MFDNYIYIFTIISRGHSLAHIARFSIYVEEACGTQMEIVPNGCSFSTSGPGEAKPPVFHTEKQHEVGPETCPDQYFRPQGLCQELDDCRV